jgi:DNA-binding PadR family transcriptional regulator
MTPARTRSPADVLPLRSMDFLVLLMLAPGERHGYGIMQDVLAHTDGRTEDPLGAMK